MKANELKQDARNYRKHSERNKELIRKSVDECGFGRSVVMDADGVLIGGNGVAMAAGDAPVRVIETDGSELVVVKRTDLHTGDEKRKLLALADNATSDSSAGDWDTQAMDEDWDRAQLDEWDIPAWESEENTNGGGQNEQHAKLTDMFIVPPFSILDTRQGYWQERKRSWLSLGIKSELGRDVKTLQTSSMQGYSGVTYESETSIFDPVLCEFSYRAFCLDGGKIFDPFAGGSVRGIVAAKLGYNYTGIDLRQEQIDANEANAREVGVQPKWICDDSLNADKYVEDGTCDLVFSCPPYFDLEEYSQDERDLSNMDWQSFCGTYERIIATAARKLKPNRFAVFVVGDVRDKKGFYRDFIGQTKSAFLKAGMQLYNDAVLVEAIGTAMMRCGTIFGKYRKLVKTHQNVLVFYNGDQKKIANEFPQLDCSKYEDVVQQDEK